MGEVRITASNGKVFHGTTDGYAVLVNEFNAYEANLKLMKQKEQEDRAKAIVEQEKKNNKENKLYQELLTLAKELDKKIEEYKKETGKEVKYTSDYGLQNFLYFNVGDTALNAWHQLYKESRKVQ